MPIQFYQQNNGLADLARTLVSAPALVQQSRRKAQDAAMQRRSEAADMQQSIADARKTSAETDLLQDQHQRRQNLGEDLNTMDAYRTDRSMRVPPPAPGSASSPLEGDVNASLRNNQDLFASRKTPGAEDYTRSFANLLRAFGGNAEQVTGGIENMQTVDLRNQAAGAAQGGDNELVAALNSVAAGNAMPAVYDTNAQGTVMNRYTGTLDESGQLAQATIADEQQGTPTPQEKRYQAAQQWNQARVNAGLPPVDDVTLRAWAAGLIDTRQDAMGLDLLQYNAATGEPTGTIDPKQGFQPFQPPQPEPEQPGMASSIWNWMTGDGEEGGTPQVDQSQGFYSPLLQREVTQAEIERTAQNRGITPEQVKQQLGIQ